MKKKLLELHIQFVCRDLGVQAEVKEYVEELSSSTENDAQKNKTKDKGGKEKTINDQKQKQNKKQPEQQQQQQQQRPDKVPLPGKPVPFFFYK